ncbi:MAG: DUF1206 domain-containing protein [Marinobacter sp.]|uniref:DUF1206 domain-containing protein n=1 Tax=Marinobacter sp. TaxID=50741 RepID=UPI002650A0A2|nr:DUF1206 domain-containing protein [Marinobacter sp.]
MLTEDALTLFARAGYAASGIVYLLVGGIAELFETFRGQPFGMWLMAFVAAGLFAFGAYSILEAFYRRVNPSAGTN